MKITTVLLLAVATPAAIAATAYRWTDASGVVHYEQTPPVKGQYQTVHPELPPPASAPPGDNGNKAFLKRIEEQDTAKTKARADAASAKEALQQQCSNARAQLQFLDERPPNRLRMREQGGELRRMDADEWEKQRKTAADTIKQSCRP
ncbi:DUF4124 domain-containing protein [Hydrocarboniphaga sp.]|uniref:DUF4124 domain-containing protein n=1 Tax=Hydrocarboniphaga sp. TaxID=2033016 RepID=UPI003D11CCE1